jgi:hypothetical protein
MSLGGQPESRLTKQHAVLQRPYKPAQWDRSRRVVSTGTISDVNTVARLGVLARAAVKRVWTWVR